MRLRRQFLPVALLVSSGIWGCHPYDRLQGEFNAGSIDPFDFAPPYRTSNGLQTNGLAAFGNPSTCVRQTAGSCTISEFRAFINGNAAGYFRFPFSPSQITTTQYAPVATAYGSGAAMNPANFFPLRVSGAGAIPTPNVYVFDPPAGSPVRCTPPSGYSYDAYRDAVHYDDQGYIFTGLPSANYGIGSNPSWTYTPVVQEVPVTSNGERCQDIKSEITVLTRSDVTAAQGPIRPDGSPTGQPDGTYYAWALIDPGALVFKASEALSATNFGFSHHRYGWFNQFLVAYLDGGQIQIVPASNPPRMATQRIFYPRTNVQYSCNVNADCARFPGTGTCETATQLCHTSTACTADAQCPGSTCDIPAGQCRQSAAGTPGQLGLGYDVMEFARGSAGYSPVCQVQTYALAAVTPTANLPRNATDITALGGVFLPPASPGAPGGPITPTFMFCLQVQP